MSLDYININIYRDDSKVNSLRVLTPLIIQLHRTADLETKLERIKLYFLLLFLANENSANSQLPVFGWAIPTTLVPSCVVKLSSKQVCLIWVSFDYSYSCTFHMFILLHREIVDNVINKQIYFWIRRVLFIDIYIYYFLF